MLVTLPLAPVRGVVFLAGQLERIAEDQATDESIIQAEWQALQEELNEGRMSDDEYRAAEEALVDRLLGVSPTTDETTFHESTVKEGE
jgi:hypothetical protein